MIENLKQHLIDISLCRDNEYLDKYVKLILNNEHTVKQKFRTHLHHIVPRFYYKDRNEPIDNTKDNLVMLLYSDHVLAHYYLAMCGASKIIRDKNLCAVQQVIRGFQPYTPERQLIERLPEIQSFYEEAKHITCIKEDTPAKIADAIRGRIMIYNGQRYMFIYPDEFPMYEAQGWRHEHSKHSDAAKDKIRQKTLGTRIVNNDVHTKRVHLDELQSYLDQGYELGIGNCRKYTSRKGVKAVRKDGKVKYVDPKDVSRHIAEGYELGGIGTPGCCKGIKRSREFSRNQSETRRGLKAVHKGKELHYVKPEKVQSYLDKGFELGKGYGHPSVVNRTCVYKDNVNKYIEKEDLSKYILLGWTQGRCTKK